MNITVSKTRQDKTRQDKTLLHKNSLKSILFSSLLTLGFLNIATTNEVYAVNRQHPRIAINADIVMSGLGFAPELSRDLGKILMEFRWPNGLTGLNNEDGEGLSTIFHIHGQNETVLFDRHVKILQANPRYKNKIYYYGIDKPNTIDAYVKMRIDIIPQPVLSLINLIEEYNRRNMQFMYRALSKEQHKILINGLVEQIKLRFHAADDRDADRSYENGIGVTRVLKLGYKTKLFIQWSYNTFSSSPFREVSPMDLKIWIAKDRDF